MRANTVKALGAIGNLQSLSVIIPFAADTCSRVRRQVAVTLGEMADLSVLPVLEELCRDGGVDVMSAAERAKKLVIERSGEPEEATESI